jgi:amino-acid N-acetyltransferase
MPKRPRLTLRRATAAQAPKLFALISANQEEGRLLPRTLEELRVHADRIVVAIKGRQVVGCAELAPLSPHTAEVRSLVVDPKARGLGIGGMLVDELRQQARREGFDKLCAFTHRPGYFIQMGFSIVPHLWLTEKVFTDCVKCPLFRQCGQFAMEVPLDGPSEGAERGVGVPASAALRSLSYDEPRRSLGRRRDRAGVWGGAPAEYEHTERDITFTLRQI